MTNNKRDEIEETAQEQTEFAIKEIKPYIKGPREQPMAPYSAYASHPAWAVVNHAIDELIENEDLTECTVRKHIVGPIVKELVDKGFLIDKK